MTINWVFLVAIGLALVSLFFSAHGLTALFAGAVIPVLIMTVMFESAKVVGTVWLLNHWRWRPLQLLLSTGVACLILVSTVGIYGYLSEAYDEPRAAPTADVREVGILRADIESLTAERASLYAQVEAIPEEHSTNRRLMLETVGPRIQTVDSLLTVRREEARTLETQTIREEYSIGQLRHAANLLDVDQERLAQWIIALLSTILDPLAVLLILASGVTLAGKDLNQAETMTTTPPPSAPRRKRSVRGASFHEVIDKLVRERSPP